VAVAYAGFGTLVIVVLFSGGVAGIAEMALATVGTHRRASQ
jgi:hypothetical protein